MVVQGWMCKRGGVNPAWKRRWFVLVDTDLRYYRDEREARESSPLGSINIANSIVEIAPETAEFDIISPSRMLRLQAESATARLEWIDAIMAKSIVLHDNDEIMNIERGIREGELVRLSIESNFKSLPDPILQNELLEDSILEQTPLPSPLVSPFAVTKSYPWAVTSAGSGRSSGSLSGKDEDVSMPIPAPAALPVIVGSRVNREDFQGPGTIIGDEWSSQLALALSARQTLDALHARRRALLQHLIQETSQGSVCRLPSPHVEKLLQLRFGKYAPCMRETVITELSSKK